MTEKEERAEKKKLRTMVEEDIAHAEAIWKESSYDSEKLERLFHLLLEHYAEKIEGFVRGLHVVQPYDATADRAEIYRQNVSLLMDRLKGFRENGCKNEGLAEYYIRRERQDIDKNADFTATRLKLGMLPELNRLEKEEIMAHLDEMEMICAQAIPKKEKWEALREHMVWLSGKDVRVMLLMLPLFFRING